MSVYDAIQELDGTFTRTAHRGTKVNSGTLAASAEGEARAWRLTLDLRSGAVETVNATEFPAPADTDYPCGPYVLSHVAGQFKIGVDRDEIDNITLSADNGLVEKWFESQFPLRTNTYGRNTTLSLNIVRKTTPDDYTAYKGVAAHDAEFTLDNDEVTAKIDLHGNNHWSILAKQLPDGDIYGWQATLKNKIDAAVGTDLTVTVADVVGP